MLVQRRRRWPNTEPALGKYLWNKWSFRPPFCTYRIPRTRRTSWGWWDEWDDPALQTQDSKFEPWWSEANHVTSWSRRFPTILNFYEWVEKKHFVSLKPEGQSGVQIRDLWLSKQAALTTAPGPPLSGMQGSRILPISPFFVDVFYVLMFTSRLRIFENTFLWFTNRRVPMLRISFLICISNINIYIVIWLCLIITLNNLK